MSTSRELPDDLQRALTDVARVPRLLVASDFDGTIAPIVSNPSDARPIPAAAARQLVRLVLLGAGDGAAVSLEAVVAAADLLGADGVSEGGK